MQFFAPRNTYRQGESPYEIFKDRMSAISSIVTSVKGLIERKYHRGLFETYLSTVNKEISEDQGKEIINLFNKEPDESIYGNVEDTVTRFVDNEMSMQMKKEIMMGGLPAPEAQTTLPDVAPRTSRLTQLEPEQEAQFMKDYIKYATENNLNRDPNDPLHCYDYRGNWLEEKLETDEKKHLSDKWKLKGHPTYPKTEVMIPKSDTMELFNAVSSLDRTDWTSVTNYMKENRPRFMGSFSPMEQGIFNQILGEASQRDRLTKDIKTTETAFDFFAEPAEKEKPMKYISTPYGILDKTTGELREVEKPEEEVMKYTSTPYGILDKITGEIMKVEKIEEDKPEYQIKTVTDKEGNTYSFYINKDDPSATAIPVKGLPVGKGTGTTPETKPPTYTTAEKIEEGFMEKVENVQDFGNELKRLKSLGIDVSMYETTEYVAGIFKKKHKEMMDYVKFAFDKMKEWNSLSEEEQAGEKFTYEQHKENYKEYWEKANNYDQQYFNLTGQHLLESK